jgi:hypothetical protein
MFTLEKINSDTISVKCKYSKDYVERLRTIPGYFYNKDTKIGYIPLNSFYDFEFEFKGEIVYKTPRWVITGDKMPDMSAMYKINRDITLPQMKIQPYDYQQYGIKFMIDRLLDNRFVINADSVGTGKTAMALTTINCLS